MGDLDEDTLNSIIDTIMAEGGEDAGKAVEACQEGMKIVGDRFEEGEYFVGDLIYAGEILSNAIEKVKPALGSKSGEKAGKMLLCTVHDDLHDIGKNIVKSVCEASGLEVIDLGIDTPVNRIIDTVKEQNIKVVALSGVLTLAIDSMKDTVDALKAEGLEDVKVIIGGAPVSEEACRHVGADAWTFSPQTTADTCKKWLSA